MFFTHLFGLAEFNGIVLVGVPSALFWVGAVLLAPALAVATMYLANLSQPVPVRSQWAVDTLSRMNRQRV